MQNNKMCGLRCIRFPIKVKCGFTITVALMINFLAVYVNKSLQDVSPMEVDYQESSRMDVDVNFSPNDDVCVTEGCYNAAQLIRNNINENADPCKNFFDFACGGFVSKAVVSENKPTTGHLHEVQEKVMKEISKVLQEDIHPTEPRIFKLAKQYYKTCLDKTSENKGLSTLSEIVGQLGGWPIILGDSWQANNFDWVETDIKLREIGFIPQYIMNFYVYNDIYNSSRNILHIAPTTLELNPVILKLGLNHKYVQMFHNFMINVAVYLGADRIKATQDLADVLTFEMMLNDAASAPNFGNTNNFTIQDLEDLLPGVSWLKYLNGITGPAVHIEMNNTIYVDNNKYLNQLFSIMEMTPKRIIANYMIWRVIYDSIPYLNTALRDMYIQFLTAFNGKEPVLAPRWEICTDLLINKVKGIPVGVSSLYINRFFNEETRGGVRDIIHAIGDEFKLLILKLSWLDDATKINVIRKSLFMKQIVGYPDQLNNHKIIDDYSRHLEIYPDNFLKNVLNVQKFNYEYAMSGLTEPINKRSWLSFTDSTSINAYYYSVFNSFVVLAAFLQPPLFNNNWPSYMKYGSLGFIIGHEIMHAYDTGRIMYDETGSYNPRFSYALQMEYSKRISCYIKQYEQYKDNELGLHVNGKLTINENLADNVGIKVAYNAYKEWEQEHVLEEKLPGLNYTQEQIFWISSVNFLCSKDTPEYRMNLLLNEVHTPDKFRASGHISNSEEFAKAFNCPKNSPMNPTQKCSLL